jgi:hypothetical protein
MKPSDVRLLRQIARELGLPASAVQAGLDCDLFAPAAPAIEYRRTFRQMRRLMLDLEVNAPGAALLVRMSRRMARMQYELERLRRMEPDWLDEWEAAVWRELAD